MVQRPGPWPWLPSSYSTFLIIGVFRVYAECWIHIGQSASPTTRYDQEPISHRHSPCKTSLLIWTHLQSWLHPGSLAGITGLCLPKNWKRRPGWPRQTLRLRTVEGGLRSSVLAWRLHNGVHRTGPLGASSWKRLRRRQAPAPRWWWWWWWLIQPTFSYSLFILP